MADYEIVQQYEEPYFWLQCQAPAGNWYDSLGSQNLDNILSMKSYEEARGNTCRVVTKVIQVLNL